MPILALSGRTLNILAALFWYAGGIVLLGKGGRLLVAAASMKAAGFWPWVVGFAALGLGVVKAKWLFAPSCRRNLRRIAALETPRFWQFFRPGFFAFLLVMILVGAALSHLAQGSYPALLTVGFIDWTIAAALLVSSSVFWNQNAFAESTPDGGHH